MRGSLPSCIRSCCFMPVSSTLLSSRKRPNTQSFPFHLLWNLLALNRLEWTQRKHSTAANKCTCWICIHVEIGRAWICFFFAWFGWCEHRNWISPTYHRIITWQVKKLCRLHFGSIQSGIPLSKSFNQIKVERNQMKCFASCAMAGDAGRIFTGWIKKTNCELKQAAFNWKKCLKIRAIQAKGQFARVFMCKRNTQ